MPTENKKRRAAQRDPRDHGRHKPKEIDLAAIEHKPTFTIAEFCARHRITRQTLTNWGYLGIGPAIARCGGRPFITREGEKLWIARCAASPAPAPAMPGTPRPRHLRRPYPDPVSS